jgi:hypothetical protein
MAELEKVKRDRMMNKAFGNLENETKKTLEMALKSIGEIEDDKRNNKEGP